jgi:hypothetical protein
MEKEEAKKLKQKQRDRMSAKTGKMDIAYEVRLRWFPAAAVGRFFEGGFRAGSSSARLLCTSYTAAWLPERVL